MSTELETTSNEHDDVATHDTDNKMVEVKSKKLSITRWIYAFIAIVILFLIAILWPSKSYQGNGGGYSQPTSSYVVQKDSTKGPHGITPCTLTFDYKARVVVSGPVNGKYPGIRDLVYYDGVHDNPVLNRCSGPVTFTSDDPNNPHVEVQIWQLLY